jgi:2-C-methyl-D-erythritol 4-phosphate cytidylyltransferase
VGARLPRTWAIVVAAGSGARFGGPKQFRVLGGRTVLEHSIERARAVAEQVVAVMPPEAGAAPGADLSVPGGATRSDSVRAGLAAVPDGVPVVVVHDAARPLASADLFRAVVGAVAAGADGAVPGIAVPDTVKRVGPDGAVAETLDRTALVLVQTPQAFATPALRRAHQAGGQATDDAALVEAAGGRVVVVPGEPGNLKITVVGDLARAEALIGRG